MLSFVGRNFALMFECYANIIQPFQQAITSVVAKLERSGKTVSVGDGLTLKINCRQPQPKFCPAIRIDALR